MIFETKEYHYSCGEPQCCDEYGVILYIDGKEVEDRVFGSVQEAYQYIIEDVLGHEAYQLEDDEE
jgi:hypothetical protein